MAAVEHGARLRPSQQIAIVLYTISESLEFAVGALIACSTCLATREQLVADLVHRAWRQGREIKSGDNGLSLPMTQFTLDVNASHREGVPMIFRSKLYGGSRHLSPIYLLVALLASCDGPESGTGRTHETRCESDGLCWKLVGKRSFEGAYRKGDDEIKFDAIFAPARTLMTQFRDEWAYRLIDSRGNTFSTWETGNMPESWLAKEKINLPVDSGEQQEFLRCRTELTREFASVFVQTLCPDKKLRQAWKDFQYRLRQGYLIDQNETSAMTESKYSKAFFAPSRQIRMGSQDAQGLSEDDAIAYSGEKLLDDDEPHAEYAEGVDAAQEDEEDSSHTFLISASDGRKGGLSGFSFGAKSAKRTYPAERREVPGKEFQQELDLYWKHTKSFLFAGWKTGKHHSAACIRVRQRTLNSDEPWQEIERICTENHGSRAGDEGMMFYDACRNLPVTKEWFVWKGECGGKFPTHYCNDDTALQIRHAHGIYDDGKKCLKRKRTHRPWCNVPW